MKETSLSNVIFISLPENLVLPKNDLALDPSILLPVDTSPSSPEQWSMKDLSWESIESGILKVLAWDSERTEIPYYRRLILQLHPGILKEILAMGITKTRNSDFELAGELFQCLTALDPDSSASFLNRAVYHEAYANHLTTLNRSEDAHKLLLKARHDYQEALQKSTVPNEAYYLAGLFYFSQGDYSYSYSLLNSFLDKAPADDKRREKAMNASQTIQKLEEEKTIYQNAYRDIEADNNTLGIQKIQDFLQTNPHSWNGWFLLGWAQRKEKQWEQALKSFKKAEKIKNDVPDLLNEMAICQMEQSRFERSKTLLEKALQLDPRDLRVLSNRAIVELKCGAVDHAIHWFQEVLKVDPQDELAQKYLEQLQKG